MWKLQNNIDVRPNATFEDRTATAFQIYDIARGEWSIGPSMSISRAQAMCAYSAINKAFYMFGGCIAQDLCTDYPIFSIEKYDTTRNEWTRITQRLSTARSGGYAVEYLDYIFLIGGQPSGNYEAIWSIFGVFDPITDKIIDTKSFQFIPNPSQPQGVNGFIYSNRVKYKNNDFIIQAGNFRETPVYRIIGNITLVND